MVNIWYCISCRPIIDVGDDAATVALVASIATTVVVPASMLYVVIAALVMHLGLCDDG